MSSGNAQYRPPVGNEFDSDWCAIIARNDKEQGNSSELGSVRV
jgi:hypothetical protein